MAGDMELPWQLLVGAGSNLWDSSESDPINLLDQRLDIYRVFRVDSDTECLLILRQFLPV
jgi:hypothetical protein